MIRQMWCDFRSNRNIWLTFVSSFLRKAGGSVWGFVLMSNVLYLFDPSTFRVGLVEGIQGVASILLSVPFGILGDKTKKHVVVKIGVVIKAIALGAVIAIPTWATRFSENPNDLLRFYWPFLGAVSVYGCGDGIGVGSEATLFSNSVPTGTRSQWFTLLGTLGMCLGPVFVMILLKTTGKNTWDLPDLIIPWNVTVGLNLLGLVFTFFLHDKSCIPDEKMGVVSKKQKERRFLCLRSKHIPIVCLVIDLLIGVASGMSIKFFPIFFQEVVGYSPLQLQALFLGVFLAISIVSMICMLLSKRIGRVQALIAFPYISYAFYTALILGKRFGYWKNGALLGVIYVFRTSFANAPGSLHQSIVDDFVDSKRRGFWNALEFSMQVTWSGSALLGGVLLERIGFEYTFVTTLVLQFVAVSCYFFLIPLVPRKEHSLEEKDAGDEEIQPLIN